MAAFVLPNLALKFRTYLLAPVCDMFGTYLSLIALHFGLGFSSELGAGRQAGCNYGGCTRALSAPSSCSRRLWRLLLQLVNVLSCAAGLNGAYSFIFLTLHWQTPTPTEERLIILVIHWCPEFLLCGFWISVSVYLFLLLSTFCVFFFHAFFFPLFNLPFILSYFLAYFCLSLCFLPAWSLSQVFLIRCIFLKLWSPEKDDYVWSELFTKG